MRSTGKPPTSGLQGHGRALKMRTGVLRTKSVTRLAATGPGRSSPPQPQKETPAAQASALAVEAAVAAKLTAARELARRLSEERTSRVGSSAAEAGQSKKALEEASVAAATTAARADALARALRRAESSRDQLTRLRKENEALRVLLVELAADKDAARQALQKVYVAVPAPAAAASAPSTRAAAPSTSTATPTSSSQSSSSGSSSDDEVIAHTSAGPAPVSKATPEADLLVVNPDAPSMESTDIATATVPRFIRPSSSGGAARRRQQQQRLLMLQRQQQALELQQQQQLLQLQQQKQQQRQEQQEAQQQVQQQVQQQQQKEEARRQQATAAAASAPPPVALLAPGPPQISLEALKLLAAKAAYSQYRSFTVPAEAVPVGQPATLYYNRAAGPLKQSGQLQVKAGFNKWESMVLQDLQRCGELPVNAREDWWSATLDLPSDLHECSYVIQDPSASICDNNALKDYPLPLLNAPTEAAVLKLRTEMFRVSESARQSLLEEEEQRLWRIVEGKALEAATLARLEHRRVRDLEIEVSAQQVVADRRRPGMLAAPTASSAHGVFKWAEEPAAGARVLLAYNKSYGLLARGTSVRVHVGYDGWWNKSTQDVQRLQLTATNPSGPSAPHSIQGKAAAAAPAFNAGPSQWYGAYVDVPYSAAVVDFVLSDHEQLLWDNNNAQDFHTAVLGARSGVELIDLLCTALRQDSSSQDLVAENKVAAAAVRRIEAKAEALRKRRAARLEFLYTIPLTPVAGKPCDIFYNPDRTVLRGRPDIHVRGSWNRHAMGR
ncbi:MAG: hypothetical protein WDW36_003778 [Sanguina aurantia]